MLVAAIILSGSAGIRLCLAAREAQPKRCIKNADAESLVLCIPCIAPSPAKKVLSATRRDYAFNR
jgi:mannose-1-phosphate guanylyltransferase